MDIAPVGGTKYGVDADARGRRTMSQMAMHNLVPVCARKCVIYSLLLFCIIDDMHTYYICDMCLHYYIKHSGLGDSTQITLAKCVQFEIEMSTCFSLLSIILIPNESTHDRAFILWAWR